jgi:hypothetical protein
VWVARTLFAAAADRPMMERRRAATPPTFSYSWCPILGFSPIPLPLSLFLTKIRHLQKKFLFTGNLQVYTLLETKRNKEGYLFLLINAF